MAKTKPIVTNSHRRAFLSSTGYEGLTFSFYETRFPFILGNAEAEVGAAEPS